LFIRINSMSTIAEFDLSLSSSKKTLNYLV